MKHNVALSNSYSDSKEMCALLGLDLTEDQYDRLILFADFLLRRAPRQNLIGPKEQSRLWQRHVYESIAFAKYLPTETIIDIGTGAGFPGMILAICGFDVIMVESRGKRCAFLETVARLCGVACEIRNCRIEDSGPFSSGVTFTSRAVKKPEEMIRMITPTVRGDFTLVTRVSKMYPVNEFVCISDILPVPPLDREGYILQYRHSKCIER